MFRLKAKIRTRENIKERISFFVNQRFIFGATLVVFKQDWSCQLIASNRHECCYIEKYIIIMYALGSVHEKFGARIKTVPKPKFSAEPGEKNG